MKPRTIELRGGGHLQGRSRRLDLIQGSSIRVPMQIDMGPIKFYEYRHSGAYADDGIEVWTCDELPEALLQHWAAYPNI